MKNWLLKSTALVATTLFMGLAQAQVDKPIKILVGFPPGGSADLAARLVGERMSAELKQPVIKSKKIMAMLTFQKSHAFMPTNLKVLKKRTKQFALQEMSLRHLAS